MTNDDQRAATTALAGWNTHPRAREQGLVTARSGDELLVYDLERHIAHRLNHTAALLWAHCDGERSVAGLRVLLERDVGAPLSTDVVWYGIRRLDRKRLLGAGTKLPGDVVICSRRELLRRLTRAGVVMGVPVVASLAVPTALLAQVSCLPIGSDCSNDVRPCCSPGVCKLFAGPVFTCQ